MITNLIRHVQILGMDHRLLAGIELRQDVVNPSAFTFNEVSSLDLFAPNYSQGLGTVTGAGYTKGDAKMAGLYLQDMISLLPNLRLTCGGSVRLPASKGQFQQRVRRTEPNVRRYRHQSPRRHRVSACRTCLVVRVMDARVRPELPDQLQSGREVVRAGTLDSI